MTLPERVRFETNLGPIHIDAPTEEQLDAIELLGFKAERVEPTT